MEKYNFITIFQTANIDKIVIPIIQRDYAQGRSNSAIKRVREKFLSALVDAVTGKPITLDFIYGDLDGGTLIPLDGQQRLTTLFLLHWYAARKEKISADKFKFLRNFSYKTRPDARDFCAELINFQPEFDKKTLSEEIRDQSWFPLSWKKDPTISAMLTMLDAISEKFSGVQNIWRALENDAVTFYFMPIKNMGLTDEIYITMNSRGKPLTEFEHFKAEFKSRLEKIDSALAEKIVLKIDLDWTDLLWKYRDEKKLVDDGFLNYFRFLCNILLYKNNATPPDRERDAFILLDEFFTGDVRAKIDFMNSAFNCWRKVEVDKFFDERVSRGSRDKKNENPAHQSGKIITYLKGSNNFFRDCAKSENFSLGKMLMLYAFVFYLMNDDRISDSEFRRRIRIVNNLVNNSTGSEISDSETRQGGNRLPVMLRQIDSIILDGKILTLSPNFNKEQLDEEREKLIWTANNPTRTEELFALEDHYLLYGQIGVVGLENPQNFRRFLSLFECDYDLIDCALLVRFDYYQNEKNKTERYQFGSRIPRSWQNLFHRSLNNERFDETQLALEDLLGEQEVFTEDYLKKIIAKYLSECDNFELSYYYIKYAEFRPHRYGKYLWEKSSAPYLFTALWTEQRLSENAYQPFLRALVDEETFKAHYNPNLERLEFGEKYIACENAAYVVKNLETGEEISRLTINQKNGVDTEDRIQKFRGSGLI